MSKPLRFSTPGARCLSGDAARHLGPSPSSQGTGDGIVPQRWPRGAPRPLRCPRAGGGGGSAHPWHPQPGSARRAVAAGPGAACVWGRGGRGGREGCNLNPLPSH